MISKNKDFKMARRYASAVLVLGALSFAQPAMALIPPATQSNSNQSRGAANFSGLFAAGSVYNGDKTIPGRSMVGFLARLGLGLNIKFNLRPVIFGEYGQLGQTTAVTNVANQNMAGSFYNLGAGLRITLGHFFFEGGYGFVGTYNLSQQTTAGSSTVYSSPAKMLLRVGAALSRHWELLIETSLTNYAHQNSNGSDIDISANKLSVFEAGLGLGYSFF